jgi:hypothetical protein
VKFILHLHKLLSERHVLILSSQWRLGFQNSLMYLHSSIKLFCTICCHISYLPHTSQNLVTGPYPKLVQSISHFHKFCLWIYLIIFLLYPPVSRDSAVGIATGCGLDDQGVGFHVPTGQAFSLLYVVQTSSGAHPASYPMGTRAFFPGGKAAGAWSWPLNSN